MSLFSPLFRSIDREIEVLERRIELRRGLIASREHELHERLAAALTSPAAFAGAAALGFFLARGRRRGPAAAGARRSGLMARLAGVAVTLLQARYGSPYQWIARIASSMVARSRQATPRDR
ncbi:MAG TPA: hypothetical protein VGN52_17265 [Burkholderiales bacterium]|jgi:hypothetical protein